MTTQQIDLVRQAVELLQQLVPTEQPNGGDLASPRCPVTQFVQRYLARDPDSDFTSAELWQFFHEVFSSGELEPRSKAEFLNRLPAAMKSVFDARKCHNLERGDHRVRGFRGIGIRLDA
jgi:hypothetical protein